MTSSSNLFLAIAVILTIAAVLAAATPLRHGIKQSQPKPRYTPYKAFSRAGPVLDINSTYLNGLGYSSCSGSSTPGTAAFLINNGSNTYYAATYADAATTGGSPTFTAIGLYSLVIGGAAQLLQAPKRCGPTTPDLAVGVVVPANAPNPPTVYNLAVQCVAGPRSQAPPQLFQLASGNNQPVQVLASQQRIGRSAVYQASTDSLVAITDGGAMIRTFSLETLKETASMSLQQTNLFLDLTSLLLYNAEEANAVVIATTYDGANVTAISTQSPTSLSLLWHTVLPMVRVPQYATSVQAVAASSVPNAIIVTSTGAMTGFGAMRYGAIFALDGNAGGTIWALTYHLSSQRQENNCGGYTYNLASPVVRNSHGQVIHAEGSMQNAITVRDIATGAAVMRWELGTGTFAPVTNLWWWAAAPGRAETVAFTTSTVNSKSEEIDIIVFVDPNQYYGAGAPNSTFTRNFQMPVVFSPGSVSSLTAAHANQQYNSGCDVVCYSSYYFGTVSWKAIPTTPAPTPFPPGVCNTSSVCGSPYCACGVCNSCRIPGSHPPQISQCCGTEDICNC